MFGQWDGSVRHVGWSTLASAASATALPSGQVLTSILADVARGLERARVGTDAAVGFSQEDLTQVLAGVDGLRARLEQVTVAITVEASSRGAHLETGLSLHDWMGQRCPWLSLPEISDLVTVATQVRAPGHEPIGQAVANGELPVRRAARLVRALARLRPVTDAETYQEAVGLLLPVATDPRYSDKDLRVATDHLIAVALPDKEPEAAAKACHQMRGVNESSLANGSLTRFVITADKVGAAVIRAILHSPLAAPAPAPAPAPGAGDGSTGENGGVRHGDAATDGDGCGDTRTATQRRYDALLTVLGRGVSCPGAAPSTAKAKVFLSIPLQTLLDGVAGLGLSFTGETLTPGQARLMACQADLIPAVLGSDSEVLELGREVRLATPAQHKALWLRDKACTFPGCTVPATWCDAHHVIWWQRGGGTDTSNLALLCGRHHTLVHDKDLTATIDATGVTWHL